jgi:hypothetical protein
MTNKSNQPQNNTGGKKSSVLIFAVLVILIGYWMTKSHSSSRAKKNDDETVESVASVPSADSATTQPTATPLPPTQMNPPTVSAGSSPTSPPTTQSPSAETGTARSANINFDENLAHDMERDWDDLPNQVHIMQDGAGWRIVYLREGSTFAQTGLHQGDLITREELGKLNTLDSKGVPLLEKFSNVLNHVMAF